MEQIIESKTIFNPVVKYNVTNISIDFGGEPYAQATVHLLDSEDKSVLIARLPFTADELKEWGEDDSVLIPLITAKLDVTPV